MSILKPIQDILLAILRFFYDWSGDYGLAIILLTVSVRVLMLPLTIKQTKSMLEMKKLQPKLKKLQEKHKGDKQKLQEEIMKFYSDHKVNPLAGCLPLLLQLPIMFSLFSVLQLKDAKLGHSFLFIIKDLGLPAVTARLSLPTTALVPYLVLIVVLVVSTYIPSKMMSSDPQQDKMMLFMSVFMAYLGWTLPAGVLLYLVVSNLWTVGQQYITLRGTKAVT
ncbi:MAG: YidC/Oxa1 family membrane protein insertase [Actinomycetota bacterium]|nr:YidC/Oxa1 family membrane protein insertase [Actinomycetota bacterium]